MKVQVKTDKVLEKRLDVEEQVKKGPKRGLNPVFCLTVVMSILFLCTCALFLLSTSFTTRTGVRSNQNDGTLKISFDANENTVTVSWSSRIKKVAVQFSNMITNIINRMPSHGDVLKIDKCVKDPANRIDCHPDPGATEGNCLAKGCCWHQVGQEYPWCFYPQIDPVCEVSEIQRLDCYPEQGASQDKCIQRGCCWVPAKEVDYNIPWCFFKKDANSNYQMTAPAPTSLGFTSDLTRTTKTRWPNDVMKLKLDVMFETSDRLHFKIYDPQNKRFEVPIATPKTTTKASYTNYDITFSQGDFGIIVKDKKGNKLFDCSVAPLTFADQFIEITTSVSTPFIYGLGERRGRFAIDMSKGQKISFWARDIPPMEKANLYGVHPFFLGHSTSGSFGVFLLNSNAMEVIVDKDMLSYRTLGGILDFYVFTGVTPDLVIQHYNNVIGRPIMPPYWALGFHLCRWGYDNSQKMKAVIKRMRDGKFPYDVQWNDIDYMIAKQDFTYDKTNFAGLPAIVDDLHANGQHYMMIIDPAIHDANNYEPYQKGLDMNVFIKEDDNKTVLIGQVWPGTTAYPDFTHPNATEYWGYFAKKYHDQVKYDGMWIDMNEPSSFVQGSVNGCSKSSLNNPPYTPGIIGGLLYDKTICPSAKQYLSTHYNLHSMYGYYETVVTNLVLKQIYQDKRFLIISRSTFAGSGRYGSHWLGDNFADYNNLRYSIAGILSFNMFGYPFVGADICGFLGATNEELCTRWMQLGAFYPFMRNHNDHLQPDQDPANSAMFSTSAQNIMRNALLIRYSLLPYLYTEFYKSYLNGTGVVRPLFFQYPNDPQTFNIDSQYMFGNALMVTPVLDQGKTSVDAYVPNDAWYDWFTGKRLDKTGSQTFDAPLNKINVHMRGGTFVTTQEPAVTTTLSRKLPFNVTVALRMNTAASFSDFLYWDDGETNIPRDALIGNIIKFSVVQVSAGAWRFTSTRSGQYNSPMNFNSIRVLGVTQRPTQVQVNGQTATGFTYDQDNQVLVVRINGSLTQNVSVDWKLS